MPICPQATWTVLLLNGVDHVVGRQVADVQPVRIDPDPHAVVALPEDRHVAHSRQADQLLADVHQRVIAQVELVVAAGAAS